MGDFSARIGERLGHLTHAIGRLILGRSYTSWKDILEEVHVTLAATRDDETPKTNGAAKLGVRRRRRRIPNAQS